MYEHKPAWSPWYHRFPWTGPNGLRYVVLARDPVCKICNRYPSTIADHIKPHKGNWELFVNIQNIQGVCKACHDTKTAVEDGGFGTVVDTNAPAATGGEGKQFTSGNAAAQKAAVDSINFEDLLKVQIMHDGVKFK